MAIETATSEIRFERATGDQPAGTREAATLDRKAVEETRRAGFGAGGSSDSAGRINEPAEAKGGRYDCAPERAGEEEAVAGGLARFGSKSGEISNRPNE